jgi:hypothetical protein
MSEGPDNLGSHEIGARSLIVIAPYVLHRHERLWDRPDMFDPSRFLPPARSEVPRFAYLPFGAVPHLHRIILCAAGGDDRVGGADATLRSGSPAGHQGLAAAADHLEAGARASHAHH